MFLSIPRGLLALTAILFCPAAAFAQAKSVLLHSFGKGTDGLEPQGGLTQSVNGDFYGTTTHGGKGGCANQGCGTVYRMSVNGQEAAIASFDGGAIQFPLYGGLTIGGDGNLYGLARGGSTFYCSEGEGLCKAAYRATPEGVVTVFPTAIGVTDSTEFERLMLGNDGGLYGGGPYVGMAPDGGIFRISSDGAYEVIANFLYDPSQGIWGGADPVNGLAIDGAGNFFGVTESGGRGDCRNGRELVGCGVIYEVTPSGQVTTVYSLERKDVSGVYTAGPLALADGGIYGLTWSGGGYGWGSVVRLDPSGYSTLYSFENTPTSPMLLASDGNFYVATVDSACGSIYRITPAGAASVAAAIECSGGNSAIDSMDQGADGNLYATSPAGGAQDGGAAYQVQLGLPPLAPTIASFSPASGGPGTRVTLHGVNEIQVRSIQFGGVAAKFKMFTPHAVVAIVPVGAVSGPIAITTVTGSGISTSDFTVN